MLTVLLFVLALNLGAIVWRIVSTQPELRDPGSAGRTWLMRGGAMLVCATLGILLFGFLKLVDGLEAMLLLDERDVEEAR